VSAADRNNIPWPGNCTYHEIGVKMVLNTLQQNSFMVSDWLIRKKVKNGRGVY
jgi:hypothetical protein